MKKISPALQAFLLTANGIMSRADLVSITLPNGMTLNVVSGTNTDIVFPANGIRFYCSKYGVWERGAFTNKADFKPSSESMELKGLIKETVFYPGTTTPLMQVINLGMLSGATVSIQSIFWSAGAPTASFYLPANLNVGWTGGNVTGISMGSMQLTVGQIGNIKNAGRSNIICEVFDLLYILNRQVPPFSIQSACRHSVFDPSCTLNVANFQSTNVPLDATSTSLYLNLDLPARASGTAYAFGNLINVGNVIYMCTTAGTSAGSAPTFNSARGAITSDGSTLRWTSQNGAYPLGYVFFTGGQNTGLKWSVKAQAITVVGSLQQLQLIKPLPFPVAPGDTIQLIPGCDKTTATCLGAFNNLIHYGGQNLVPNPEVAV